MPSLKDEIFFGWTDGDRVLRILLRLLLAVFLGALLGYNREHAGKAAGLKTHMLVCLGAALFVLAPIEAGVELRDLARIVQGLTMGIGFLGAGTIIKLESEQTVKGLTTAANLWLACAAGMAAGMGWIWPAGIAVLLDLLIMVVVGWGEHALENKPGPRER